MKKIGYIESQQQDDCYICIIHIEDNNTTTLTNEILSVWVQQMDNNDFVLDVLYDDQKQIVLADVDESVMVAPEIFIHSNHLHCTLQFGTCEAKVYLVDEFILAEIWDLTDKYSKEPIARNHLAWPHQPS
tara:strand:- start:3533 stop:3922 length:390 start_codon:yes stop_codon:yes gene_type:complete